MFALRAFAHVSPKTNIITNQVDVAAVDFVLINFHSRSLGSRNRELAGRITTEEY